MSVTVCGAVWCGCDARFIDCGCTECESIMKELGWIPGVRVADHDPDSWSFDAALKVDERDAS